MKPVVIMSGSFNPPTIAHHRTMLAVMDRLKAEKGFYVPTPAKALRYKMRKAGTPEEVLSEARRMAMLRAMAEEDPRLEVEDVECRHPRHWHQTETMDYFGEKFPEAELFYLTGSDNLAMFLRSHRLETFLEKYHFAVVTRDGDDSEAILRENPVARAHQDRFEMIPAPEGNFGISSTAVRRGFRTGDSGVEAMLHPKVFEMMKEETIWKKNW